MARLGHRDDQARRHFESFSITADVGFDARRCEQHVNDDTRVKLARRQQSDGREAAQRLLFEREPHRESATID